MQIDAIDQRILARLQEDGHLSNQDLAEQVALSPSACLRRVRALEEAGLIRGYRAVLDAEKLGFELEAYVLINLVAHVDENIARFEQAIADNPYVIACHAVTGDMDYLVRVIARNVEHLSQITLRTLLRIPGVRDVKSIIVLETIKEDRAVPVEI